MIWKEIPGTGGLYEAHPDGLIRRKTKDGYRTVTGYMRRKKTTRFYAVKFCHKGSHRERKMAHVIWETFRGPIPEGRNIVHKNGDLRDNNINNLQAMDSRELGLKYGSRACRRSCAMIDEAGEVIRVYKSAREAARDLGCVSYQTIMDRCNRKVKNEYALLGYTFRWDDEIDYTLTV